ncbi:preprotein translocase subunit YajC [Clostridiisalibacter paucivorans]|uniref:preprotein translocase subunit YajC n=1 Tax=Clostridiisalibacter paucivorans TaxID=408753 RepID=UPI00047A2624|nr:preprotein translocase subunit YajC [Clostridiisalibacter paucivorans]
MEYTRFIFPLAFLVLFYFLLIRPQQKKDKKIREMRSNLKVGDEIVTIGGIKGKIINLKDEALTIEVGADKTKLTVARWAIGNIGNREEK